MQEFIETCFSGPTLPATVLLLLVLVYWLFVMLGALDIDIFDIDLDVDSDVDSVLSIGFIPLRFLNLGRVPLMVWLSFVALSMWMLSMVFDHPLPESLPLAVQAFARNLGISLLVAKFLTNPLRDKFDPVEPNRAEDLIGQTCVITTSEVTETTGRAEHKTAAAPLLLNVRATEKALAKGELVEIVDFNPETHIYFVRRANQEG